ncbi:MAG: Holliday junction branch migration protein RuvA [Saccharofermentans sp.]|nr:Holliday junction branch migration protein RuvA [Saccharofermentans sp.]
MGMYSYIKGTIEKKDEDIIVIDNQGIGYEIICPYSISANLGSLGDSVTVWLYQSVREDDITLYGFASPEMKDMFLQLITVSGVGPKVAHSICAQVEPDRLAIAVIGGDVKFLTTVKGLGKKGAERIVLELKDKLKKAGFASNNAINAGTVVSGTTDVISNPAVGGVASDAVEALIVLGYKESMAAEVVSQCYEEGIALQELIKKSLKSMAR